MYNSTKHKSNRVCFLVWNPIESHHYFLNYTSHSRSQNFSPCLVSILFFWIFYTTPAETSMPIPHGTVCWSRLVALICGCGRHLGWLNMHGFGMLPDLSEPSLPHGKQEDRISTPYLHLHQQMTPPGNTMTPISGVPMGSNSLLKPACSAAVETLQWWRALLCHCLCMPEQLNFLLSPSPSSS